MACIRSRSLFLRGTGALIHAVVPIETCGSPRPTAPAPTAAECRSGRPVTATADAGMPSSAATAGSTGPTTDPVGDERRQPRRVHAGGAHQHVVVGQRRQRAVVGEPGPGHRGVAGGGHAGEPHGQVVDRLEEPARPREQVGLLVLQVEDVPDRVGARRRRDAAAAAQPGGQRPGRVAGDRSPDGRSRVRRPAGVAPEHARADRPALSRRRAPCVAHWPVTLTATTRDRSTDVATRRTDSTTSRHHSSASCVALAAADPGASTPGVCSHQTISPRTVTSPTLGPPVPRSTARTRSPRSSLMREAGLAACRACRPSPRG